MENYVTTIANRQATFDDNCLTIDNLVLSYEKMSNVKYRNSDKAGFIFDYEGKSVFIPCNSLEKDKMMPFFQKAVLFEKRRKELELMKQQEKPLTLDDLSFKSDISENTTHNSNSTNSFENQFSKNKTPIVNNQNIQSNNIQVKICPVCGSKVNIKNKLCPKCGSNVKNAKVVGSYNPNNNFNPNINTKNKLPFWVYIIIGIICLGFLVTILGDNNNNNKSETTESTNKSENIEVVSDWATEITPITDFDYSIDGEYIHLKEYTGESDKVWIGAKYTIDGKTYTIDSRLDGLFALDNVESVIIPEGVVAIENNIFNSCGLKRVYIPKSLKTCEFVTYLHDVDTLYYGGNEEEWKELINKHELYETSVEEGIKEIIYNAKISDIVGEVEKDQIEVPYREDVQKEIEKEQAEEEQRQKEAEEAAEELEKYADARAAATKYFATLKWNEVFKYKYKIHYLMGLEVGEPEGGSEYGAYLAIAPTEVQNGFGATSNGKIYLYMDEDYKLTHIFYYDADTSEEIYVSE